MGTFRFEPLSGDEDGIQFVCPLRKFSLKSRQFGNPTPSSFANVYCVICGYRDSEINVDKLYWIFTERTHIERISILVCFQTLWLLVKESTKNWNVLNFLHVSNLIDFSACLMPKQPKNSKSDSPYSLLARISRAHREREPSLSESSVYRPSNSGEILDDSIEDLTNQFSSNLAIDCNCENSSPVEAVANSNLINFSSNNQVNLISTMTTTDYSINPFKCIGMLPNFSGQVGTLNNFIAQVDTYHQLVPAADLLGKNVMNGLIRNKIVGEASNSLVGIGNPLEWNTVKAHLINYFSDKRSIDHLKRKLTELVQRNKSLEEYYSESSDLQTALINTVDPALSPAEKEYYIRDVSREVLREFLLGLRPDLSNYVRPQNPTNIKDAFEMARNQENYIRGQQAKLNNHSRTDIKQNLSKPLFTKQTTSQHWQPNFSSSQPRYQPQNRFSPPQSQPYRPTTYPPKNNFPIQRNPFYSPRQSNFRPNQFGQYTPMPTQMRPPDVSNSPLRRPNLPDPTPMDISVQSRLNQSSQRPFVSNNGQRPNFVSKELFTQEPIQDLTNYHDYREPYDPQSYDQYYPKESEIEYPNCENNFHPDQASYFSDQDSYSQEPNLSFNTVEHEIDDQNFPSTSHPPSKT